MSGKPPGTPQNAGKRCQTSFWDLSWAVFGASWTDLGASWAVLGASWTVLGLSCAPLFDAERVCGGTGIIVPIMFLSCSLIVPEILKRDGKRGQALLFLFSPYYFLIVPGILKGTENTFSVPFKTPRTIRKHNKDRIGAIRPVRVLPPL